MPENITFEVLLKPAGSSEPSIATIDELRPEAGRIEFCTRWLIRQGFEAHPAQFSITCTGELGLFERTFGVEAKSVGPRTGEPEYELSGKPTVPTAIGDHVEEITVSASPEFF